MTHRVPPFIEDLLAKTIAPADTEELLARFNADVWANEAYNRWIIHPDHGTVSLEFFKWLVAYEAGSQNSRKDGSSLKNPSQPVGGEGAYSMQSQVAPMLEELMAACGGRDAPLNGEPKTISANLASGMIATLTILANHAPSPSPRLAEGVGEHEGAPCGLCDTSGRCTFACETAEDVPAPSAEMVTANRYWAMLVLSAKVLGDLATPDPNLRKLEQFREACARLAAEIKDVLPEPEPPTP